MAQRTKIVVAMSGGVDSAVAAYLMKKQGYEVLGVTLKLAPDIKDGSGIKREGRCCSIDDMTDARIACDKLGIPFYAIDAQDKFKDVVFDPFIKAYQNGVTPIPCLACNHEVKFGDLFASAQSLNAELATGHYASVGKYRGYKTIKKAQDPKKDQTYYLYGTRSKIVEKIHFPLGEYVKSETRKIAKEIGFLIHDKKDSHEICFVPDNNHGKLIEKVTKKTAPGNIVDPEGKVLGQHLGIHHYTVGQRRGLHVATGDRVFVADINPQNQNIVLGPKATLACQNILVSEINHLIPKEVWPNEVEVKIRAQGNFYKASIHKESNTSIKVTFHEDVFAVALGQAAVFYDGDFMLGGGIIKGRLDGAFPRMVPST